MTNREGILRSDYRQSWFSSNGISGPEDQLHRQDVYPKGFALIFDREGWDRGDL